VCKTDGANHSLSCTAKQFYEGFKQLDERDKKIAKHVAGGKTYEETGDIVFLSGPGVKARMPGILKQLGVSKHELSGCYNELKKFRNRA
jgi:DNA-binding NarL/FixJ family response regulator